MTRAARLHRGMTLIEALLALAISTALLVAVSAAFKASADAVAINDSYFQCTQTARIAIGQMETELRRADAVKIDPEGTWMEVIRPSDQLTANEISRQYRYDADAKRLTLRIVYAGDSSSPEYELAGHITACKFGPAEMGWDYAGVAVALRVPITLTCSIGASTFTLHGSAAPRRTQRF
jgi:prepilin-type N-terminal cleavage/methylation domain-containing protein